MTSVPIIDPVQFYVRSTAPGDDAVTIDLTVPSDAAARIRQLANDDRYPEYATPDDSMRDAMVHCLQDLLKDIADPVLRTKVQGLLSHLGLDHSCGLWRDGPSLVDRSVESMMAV